MIVEYQNPYKTNSNKGFFSWLKKAVKAVVNVAINIAIPGNGYGVINALIDFVDGDGMFGGVNFNLKTNQTSINFTDLPLTESDIISLDNWLYNQFLPFYTNILDNLKQLEGVVNTHINDIIDRYNYVQEFAAYVDYMKNVSEANGQQGLSINAVKTKNAFLEIKKSYLLEQLENLLVNDQYDYQTHNKVINENKFTALDYDPIGDVKTEVNTISFIDGVNILQQNHTNNNITSTQNQQNKKGSLWLPIAITAGAILLSNSSNNTKTSQKHKN